MASTTLKLSKWGNSYGIRLPKDIVEQLGLKIGQDLDAEVQARQLRIKQPKRSTKEIAGFIGAIDRLSFKDDRKFTREEMNER